MPVLACSHVRSAPAPCGVVLSRGLAIVGASALGAEGIQGQCATELADGGGDTRSKKSSNVSRSEHPDASARDDCAESALSHRTVKASATRGIDAHLRGGEALDQLVGDRVEVLADVVRLRTDGSGGVALAEDEPGLAARSTAPRARRASRAHRTR